jgi:predicted alpha/beta hydrolase
VLRQWRRWCTRAEHFTPEIGIGKPIPNNYYDDVTAPLLFVSLSDDWIATRKTVGALQGFFSRAKLQNRWWTPQEVGAKSIGHGGFFQSRFQDSLWRETIDWIDAHLD